MSREDTPEQDTGIEAGTVTTEQATFLAYPPSIPNTQVEIYKTVDDVVLRLWIFTPEGHRSDRPLPAIVFFFGGGWRDGNPIQFRKQCEYLAGRGMVSMTADYRVSSRHGVTANQCVADAQSAVRWIRMHAERLGIDPNRIAAGGGSAGGHLAAATGTLPMCDEPNDKLPISARPDALVLFNPVVMLSPLSASFGIPSAGLADLKDRLGVEPEALSPYHHLRSGIAPIIIFHGTADTIVPYKTVELFKTKMKSQGNHCQLIGYKGAGHGFFNYGRDNNGPFIDTVNKMDAFLVSRGYLKGPPETISYE